MKFLWIDTNRFFSEARETPKSNANIDATAEVYKSLSDKILRNQDLAIGRARQLETKASWLLASYLVIFNLEYEFFQHHTFSLVVRTIIICMAVASLLPLIFVIYPKNVKVSQEYKTLVNEITQNNKESVSRNDFIRFERGSIRYTEETTNKWSKLSKYYKFSTLSSTALLIIHWCIILGAILN